jgi:hypothetical protein
VLAMSGLRAVVACRFPSPPPRGRTLCTPAREGRTWARHGHAEGHPTTRRRAAHRVHFVPRTSVNRPSSRDSFVQGRGFTPEPWPCAHQRPGPWLFNAAAHSECRATPSCHDAGHRHRTIERTPALKTGARSFWLTRHRTCGRRALLAAPPSLRTGLRAVPYWVDRGWRAWCRPDKRTPMHKPNRHRRRRRRGAAPERERAARLGRGQSASSL